MADPYRVAISGSRRYYPDDAMWGHLARLVETHPEGLFLQFGDADGVDRVAWDTARILQMSPGPPLYWVREIAHWKELGRRIAGHERNGRVLDGAAMLLAYFHPDLFVSDLTLKSSGTCDAVTQASDRGMEVHAFHRGHWLTEAQVDAITASVHRKWERVARETS